MQSPPTWRIIYLTLLGLWQFLCGNTSPAFLGARALLAMRPRKKDKGANTRPIKMPVTIWSLSQAYQRANVSQKHKQSYWRIAVLVVFVPLRGQSYKKSSLLTFNTFPYFHYQNLWQWPHTTNTLESLWSTGINQPHKDRLMLNQLAACQNDTLTTCITCGGPRCDPCCFWRFGKHFPTKPPNPMIIVRKKMRSLSLPAHIHSKRAKRHDG